MDFQITYKVRRDTEQIFFQSFLFHSTKKKTHTISDEVSQNGYGGKYIVCVSDLGNHCIFLGKLFLKIIKEKFRFLSSYF